VELLRNALDANLLTCINQEVMNWLEKLGCSKKAVITKHVEAYGSTTGVCCLPRAVRTMIRRYDIGMVGVWRILFGFDKVAKLEKRVCLVPVT
jgi:hypothetical protein